MVGIAVIRGNALVKLIIADLLIVAAMINIVLLMFITNEPNYSEL